MRKLIISKISLFIFLVFATSCNAGISSNEQKVINDLLQSKKSRKFEEGYLKKTNSDGCSLLINLSNWEKSENKLKVWGRYYSWINPSSNWKTITGIDVDYDSSSPKILTQAKAKKKRFVYIGPWKYNSTIQKEVRFFAYQDPDGDNLNYQFETKNKKNSKILEKPLTLSKKYPPRKFDLCVVKWIAKYGYNSYAENYRQLKPGFWNWILRNKELVITGKIVETKK